jgi:hypothetical protein
MTMNSLSSPSDPKLRACPFCGGPAAFEQHIPEKYPNPVWTVHCDNQEEDCFAGKADFAVYSRKVEAAEAWNTRKPPQSPPTEIEGEVLDDGKKDLK